MAKGVYQHKPLTEQHKANIRAALKGKMPKNIKSIAAWNKGLKGAYKTSEETKRKISEHHKKHGVGKWMTGRGGELHANWKGGLPNCNNCGKKLSIRHPLNSKILCQICFNRTKKGKNNPNWKSGITPLVMRIRHCEKYINWRKSIMQRDDYTCQICETRGGKLVVDHIIPFITVMRLSKIDSFEKANKPNFLWETSNGRTLCEDCHKKTPTYMQGARLIDKLFI